jgi:hypothetical protein
MRYTVNEINVRLARLRTNPVENAKLIKKWERMLRRAIAEEQ